MNIFFILFVVALNVISVQEQQQDGITKLKNENFSDDPHFESSEPDNLVKIG